MWLELLVTGLGTGLGTGIGTAFGLEMYSLIQERRKKIKELVA